MAPTKNKRVTIFKISNSFSGAYANNESNLHLPTRRSNDNEPHIMTIDDNRLAERRNRDSPTHQQQSITFADNQAVYAMLMATDTSLTPLPHSPAPRSQAICLISPLHHSIIDHCPCTKIHRSLNDLASVAASH